MKISEGFGIVVLERAEEAMRRGVKPIAYFAGWGESADSFHLTRPQPDGGGAARSMRMALSRADVMPSTVDLIAAHATGTPDNDAAEAAAITLVTAGAPMPVVGFKSHLGHTLGGAGAIELILSAQAIRHQQRPGCSSVVADEIEYPNLNLQIGPAVPAKIETTLNTSLGFGGANTSAVLRRQRTSTQKRELLDVVITGVGTVGDGLNAGWPTIPLAELEQHLDPRKARRLSLYVKLMLAASSLAVKNSNLPAGSLEHASAILGTTHGSPTYSYEYYQQIVREGVAAANPMLFAEGVPNAGAAHVSLTFGIKGGCRTIIGTRSAGLDALRIAILRIANGDVPLAVVGAAEEAHTIIDQAYQACDPSAPPSISAAVALILETRDAALHRGAAMVSPVYRSDIEKSRSDTADGLFSVGSLLNVLRHRAPTGHERVG
jgi:3-oxoacyl-(acyl-carrier-protein) synthase